ncbi:MAG: carboxypeptidase regulatory-like domain-containing protein, partial [Candidatus Marinimicrobia bacterium]|nr:carboxypeptidase regulatory-like domain-containing protein [Candidatus Neomarinimicrobiota bacterium]
MRKLTSLSICALILPIALFAQTTGKISGTVKGSDGTPLVAANVVITGTSQGSSSDKEGNFVILNVPVGSYAVRVDYIGYKSVT